MKGLQRECAQGRRKDGEEWPRGDEVAVASYYCTTPTARMAIPPPQLVLVASEVQEQRGLPPSTSVCVCAGESKVIKVMGATVGAEL